MVGPAAAGAAAIAPRRVDQAIDLALASLHVRLNVLLSLRAQCARLLGGLGSRRLQQLLGGGAYGEQAIHALTLSVSREALGLRLSLGDDQASPLLRITHDVCGGGVEACLIEDLDPLRLRRGPDLIGLRPRPLELGFCLQATLVRRTLGGLDVGFGAQPGTVDRRIRLQTPAGDQSLGFTLDVGDRALPVLQALLELAGLLPARLSRNHSLTSRRWRSTSSGS